jgi:hypothetical protein
MNARFSPTFPRRWLRFRLRTLLAFTALCAVASTYGGGVNAYYAEQRALQALGEFGVNAYYAEQRAMIALGELGGPIDVASTVPIYR